jgi:hypothetical protein
MSAWIGIETASPDLLAKHMKKKTHPAPWRPGLRW